MWTDTTRAIHARKGLALPSNLTDAEWAVLEPLVPPALPGGRPRKWPTRLLVEAMLYMLRGGLAWRMLPPGFPPMTTVQRYFYAWRDSELWQTINHHLLMDLRVAEGREASPSAGVIDSQSVKTTESGGIRGYDAGKKVKGRKRHILTDTCGYLVHAVAHAADIQARDGAPLVLAAITKRFPWLRYVFADGGYPSRRGRGQLLCSHRQPRYGRMTQTKPPPENPGRFNPTPQRALSFCLGAGWSNGHLRGSTVTAVSPKTLSTKSKPPSHGSSLPPFNS